MQSHFLEPARAEFLAAIAFYNDRRTGLGFEFADEVQKAIGRILQYPEAWAPISKRVRRCRVRRFPFGVLLSDQRRPDRHRCRDAPAPRALFVERSAEAACPVILRLRHEHCVPEQSRLERL